ncbi:MAG: hypothetical protein Q9192_007336, partial [Flavoplaca navasiana]
VFVPFYLGLLSKILSRLSSDPDYDYEHHIYRELVSKVLTSYIHRYVQPEPAVRHISVPNLGSCGGKKCANCTRMAEFLADPSMDTNHFHIARAERHHLRSVLKGMGHRLDIEQRLSGALVITKKLNSEEKKHAEWKMRLESPRKRILNLDQPSLLALLGKEDYNRITTSIDARMGSKLRKLRNKRHQINVAEVIELTS